MPQPDYVPLFEATKVRPAERLPVPDAWIADRPAETAGSAQPVGSARGRHGPDQGFGLKLANEMVPQLQLAPGEHADDVVAGCVEVGLARAAVFGRAPMVYDMRLAYGVWGFLGDAPAELVAFRRPLFLGAAHDYWMQRAIVDRVPESTLRLNHDDARGRVNVWRTILTAD